MKSLYRDIKTRDLFRSPITPLNLVEKTSFLRGFVDWLDTWEVNCGTHGLSKETFMCAKHTSASLAALSEFLIIEKEFSYFLLGKAQSDKIERRFGKCRQMSGGNIYASVRQFYEADRTIRIKNLAQLNLSMKEIKELFSSSKEDNNSECEERAHKIFQTIQAEGCVDFLVDVPKSDANTIFYAAGYFARRMSDRQNCLGCKAVLVMGDARAQVISDRPEMYLLSEINRGGLTIPSELIFCVCLLAWKFYSAIIEHHELGKVLMSSNLNSRNIFQKAFEKFLESNHETQNLLTAPFCPNGHNFKQSVILLSCSVFNLFAKNFVTMTNSKIHASKKKRSTETNPRDPRNYKVTKLQSDSKF